MNKLFLLSFLLFLPFLIQSCAAGITGSPQPQRHDALIGQIIDAHTAQPIALDDLIDRISRQDVIYLSEKHDNPDHHAMQHRIIRGLMEKGLSPLIGFEFFSMEDTPDLLNFIESGKTVHSKDLLTRIETDLRKKLSWDTQPDAMWAYYYGLLSLARDNQLMAAGLDLSDTLKKRITRKGLEGLTPIEKEQIFSTGLSDPVYKEYMFSIFKDVHCGMEHGQMQARLYDTWTARNDKMALSITRLKQHHKGPIVVIMGAGHTEYGLGVISRTSAIRPALTQANVTFREISIMPALLSDYLTPLDLEGYEKVPPADFLYFTQRVSYGDPCEEFRKSRLKMK